MIVFDPRVVDAPRESVATAETVCEPVVRYDAA
jgi:hypothetical protein